METWLLKNKDADKGGERSRYLSGGKYILMKTKELKC